MFRARLLSAHEVTFAWRARVPAALGPGFVSAQVADLEERLERLVSRNSGDSSMPSSSDDLPGRKAPGQRKRGGIGKRPGKKPGAPVHLHADPRVQDLLSAPDTWRVSQPMTPSAARYRGALTSHASLQPAGPARVQAFHEMIGTGNVATDRSPSARITAPNIRSRTAEPVIAIDPMPRRSAGISRFLRKR